MRETTQVSGVGVALRSLRMLADMSLDDVAKEAGISPSYLSRAETGLVTPKPAWVHLVASCIGDHLASKDAA